MWEVTLGWAAAAYAKSDPAYAAELWLAWERACAPMGLEPSPPDQVIRPLGSKFAGRGVVPAVSWPWVPACGSLEPPCRDGENAQKTGKNGEKMGKIQPKTCEGRELTKNQLG